MFHETSLVFNIAGPFEMMSLKEKIPRWKNADSERQYSHSEGINTRNANESWPEKQLCGD